jgi:hypothetical protein
MFCTPTTMNGRMSAFLIDTSIAPTTCGKSSFIPPSGMYSTGKRVVDVA